MDMLPEQFLERMERMLGEEYGAFLETFGQERHQALRLNPLKYDAEGRSAAARYGRTGGDFALLEKVPWAEDGYYYRPQDQPGKHPLHEAGVYYIQEPSAMAPAELLDVRPGERILDLCAAPGGKASQIAAKLRGRGLLVCNEIHPARAKILSENIERLGICNACVINEAPERLAGLFSGFFDKVLVDAPCSGEGMFRKNEEACGEWSVQNVSLCARRQDGILDCAAEMLRPGGRLVYSTCTFAPLENEGSVARFLRRRGDFEILTVQKKALGLEGCDGIAEYAPESESSAGAAENAPEQESSTGAAEDVPEQESSAGAAGYAPEQESSTGAAEDVPEQESSAGAAGYVPEQESGSSREEPVPGLEHTLRLWPHKIRGEGHYAAVLRKEGEPLQEKRDTECTFTVERSAEEAWRGFQIFCEENLRLGGPAAGSGTNRTGRKAAAGQATENGKPEALLAALGKSTGMDGSVRCIVFGDNLYAVPARMSSLKGMKVLRPGLHLGIWKKNRFEPSHALALALRPESAARRWEVSAGTREAETGLPQEAIEVRGLSGGRAQAVRYLRGETFPAEGEKGWYLICVEGFGIGWGKLAGGVMKNHYPKGLRKN